MALSGPILTICVLTVWRYTDNTHTEIRALDGKIEGLDRKFDAKFDTLITLLIGMKGEIGEVKGQMTSVQSQSHTHTTP